MNPSPARGISEKTRGWEFKSSPVEGRRRSPEAGPGDRLPTPWRSSSAPPPPSSFVVKALDVVVSSCANPFEPTVRSLRHHAVRLSDEICWAAAAPGGPEAALVVSMSPARLEEAENTACLGMNRVDMDCRPVPQRPAAILNGSPASVTLRVTDKLRVNLAAKL